MSRLALSSVLLRGSFRRFSLSVPIHSKTISKRVIIPPTTHLKSDSTGSASGKIGIDEFKQLPEDSDYIENFYNELEDFSEEYLKKHTKKSFADFEGEPDDLVFQVQKYVELQIVPKYTVEAGDQSRIYRSIGDKLLVERYIEFIKAMKLTLRLNGGHTFIFDLILQSHAVFNEWESNKYRNR
ncbi:hypothetical protein KAFR_0C00570 [Kazachstania africana CBS 2517]|uniref:Protein FMP23, mitochondrial n=1 Tax=Kazachstania africana (strain ATCC 22294 / BCRC 22015 / CBS 2517 / CECT 1963 / NBRC 1671 / NRRL Y-8276) TaxID=1071382 RepID=H2ARQ2_KAZAF|nr:hypothetical protein KAFR_0C00570 [Kazachstania africana CBS 2517]CCF57052.1 hypothetical protein KAFR_0C00570 [Kazachstania africana CBS 2517]